MLHAQDDTRILNTRPLLPPAILIEEIPLSVKAQATVETGRNEISQILEGKDDRLLVIAGPCSIHDTAAAMEYAQKLKKISGSLQPGTLCSHAGLF